MLSLPALQILLLQNPHACAHTGSLASNAYVSRDVRLNGLPHTAQDAVLDDSKKCAVFEIANVTNPYSYVQKGREGKTQHNHATK